MCCESLTGVRIYTEFFIFDFQLHICIFLSQAGDKIAALGFIWYLHCLDTRLSLCQNNVLSEAKVSVRPLKTKTNCPVISLNMKRTISNAEAVKDSQVWPENAKLFLKEWQLCQSQSLVSAEQPKQPEQEINNFFSSVLYSYALIYPDMKHPVALALYVR